MRLFDVAITGSIFLSAVVSVRAADTAVVAAESAVRLGLSGGYGNYEENVSPQDTEAGALLGGSFDLSDLRPGVLGRWEFSDVYADASYGFVGGFLNYKGNLQNNQETPYRAEDRADYNTVIVRLGVGRPLAGGRELIPYVAVGYQNWYRNVGGPSATGEYYQAGLIGSGLRFDVLVNSALVLSAFAEGFAVVGGTISAPSEEFRGNFGTSAEERVGLDADYRLDGPWHAYAGLGVEHYNYTGSKPDGMGVYEPSSSTMQLNSTIGLSFGF